MWEGGKGGDAAGVRKMSGQIVGELLCEESRGALAVLLGEAGEIFAGVFPEIVL